MDQLAEAPATAEPARCRVVSPGAQYEGKQHLLYNVGVSAETVGAQAIHMQIATIPPGGRGVAHKHAAHETAIYALSGESGVWHGDHLEHHSIVKPGDFFYIPANTPHVPYNPSSTEDVVVLIARTDPNEQESVALLPELDGLHR
ncbi:MAG TPA: cupin domain-containing protein [Caulobacteraceae bacterium]|jgi:uncharacterized RmlC-like cupin family protein|nr:cupin domain-containing protein [Caulobacteraceae bacterium]